MSENVPQSGIRQATESGGAMHSEQVIPISEQMNGLIELANLSPEQLRDELRHIVERIRALEATSRTDELTGLLNRRGFSEEITKLQAIFSREQRDRDNVILSSILAIDLDGFKEVNDTGGHACGDRCLKLVADEVTKVLRESDIFARVGGDEFSIFLPESDSQGGVLVAKKVRNALETTVSTAIRREFPSYKGTLSASIGITPVVAGEKTSIEELMREADYAAYVAKAAGKGGELTAVAATEADADGSLERAFLAGKPVRR